MEGDNAWSFDEVLSASGGPSRHCRRGGSGSPGAVRAGSTATGVPANWSS